MDEELINLTTEETFGVDTQEIIENEVQAEDLEQSIETEEIVETVEVETVEEINIDVDETIGWVGGDSARHYSLYGRDEPDQHPITAITGLREELNDIEALDVVYSNEKNHADYYLWEDENVLQENRVGYFVSACSDINKIKMCTSENDIFGVTVDSAGFIGAQSDVARDIKYGLVVTTGTVHVRCELPVSVGDYVISNDYGYAQSNKNGYKVVGRHQIDGVEYAEITLAAPINRICQLSDDVENVNQRMDDAETNIVAAINIANAAYNKAGEVGEISEEALKDALEALNKSNETSEKTDELESRVEDANELAVQAKAISESAANSAETIRNEAKETSDKALASVNDLIKDLEPITTWQDPESGNTGAEYFTTYIKEDLATKVEVQTVETLTNDNKSAIEKNAESIQTMVSSVDKYSVGEYSQSYGLTREQAKSILKVGMIYVPTKHSDSDSHSETFGDETEPQWFTPHNYYVWNGNDWIEHSNSVAFFSEEPIPSSALQYWYVDSNEAPDGYEAHALYMNQDGQWTKVNILDGNVNNRLTSMIRQTTNEISAEVTNARGSAATLGARITDTESEVQSLALWSKGGIEDGEQYNLATIKQTADVAGASIAQVVESVGENGEVNAASIVTAINTQDKDSESFIRLNADVVNITADDINLEGYVTIENLKGEGTTVINGSNITTGAIQSENYVIDTSGMKLNLEDGTWDSANFKIDEEGKITATGGTIGDWKIHENYLGTDWGNPENVSFISQNGTEATVEIVGTKNCVFYSKGKFAVDIDGKLYANGADILGGTIGGWNLEKQSTYSLLYSAAANVGVGMSTSQASSDPAFWAGLTYWGNNPWQKPSGATDEWYNHCNFYVTHAGYLYAKNANISGTISAGSILQDGIKVGTTQQSKFMDYSKNTTVYKGTEWSTTYSCISVAEDSNSGTAGEIILSVRNNANSNYTNIILNGLNGGQFTGTWGSPTALSTDSDINLKNTISNLSDSYSILFDNLKPVTYKYNNGTSDRLHTGFIAQEVKDALNTANIDTKDFAGLVIYNQGKEDEKWTLRYDEFIALNTWQIQKAKARIAELEEKVAQLEALIKGE